MQYPSYLFSILFTASLLSCRQESINCGVDCGTPTEELLFQTGFEGTTLTNGAYQNVTITGTDPNYAELSDWASFMEHPGIGYVELSYEDGDDSQRLARIVDDPEQAGNAVLQYQIVEPHIREGTRRKGRVQLALHNNSCIRELYQTVRLRLHPDLAYFAERDDRLYWFTLFEFWNNGAWTGERNPFRVSVNLNKEAGVGSPIHLRVKADYQQCRTCGWQEVWGQTDTALPLAIGQWMEVELYLREGDADTGRFYLAVTPADGERTVLFDIRNTTHHPEETCPDGFTHFEAMKMYLGETDIGYMNEAGKTLALYWDDWRLWLNREP